MKRDQAWKGRRDSEPAEERCLRRSSEPIDVGMSTMLSPADCRAACVVALVSLLMCAGVRYVFHLPAPTAIRVNAAERPYMP